MAAATIFFAVSALRCKLAMIISSVTCLFFLPAIVIGGHRQRGVGDLGFAGAFGLAEIRHADDVVAGAVIGERFGAGAERRAFHVDISAAVMDGHFAAARRLQQDLPQFFANRMRERDMRHDAAPEFLPCCGLANY